MASRFLLCYLIRFIISYIHNGIGISKPLRFSQRHPIPWRGVRRTGWFFLFQDTDDMSQDYAMALREGQSEKPRRTANIGVIQMY